MVVFESIIIGLSVLLSLPVSVISKFLGLKGIQIWLPMSILVGISLGPIPGFLVAAITLGVSYIIKPVPLISISVMLGTLALLLYGMSFISINSLNFLPIAMMVITLHLIIVNVILSLIWPDLKTVIIFLVFGLATSWLIFSTIGWNIVRFIS